MTDVAATVREIVAKHASSSVGDDATPLGGDGVGLDSIALAEVLLECEERFGAEVADLLDGGAVTVQRIVERIGAAARP
jgi:acyl carrier protein